MLRIARGNSVYEIYEFKDRTEIEIYIKLAFNGGVKFDRNVTILKSEYRQPGSN